MLLETRPNAKTKLPECKNMPFTHFPYPKDIDKEGKLLYDIYTMLLEHPLWNFTILPQFSASLLILPP